MMRETSEALALRKAGLGSSHPRIKILQYLRSNYNHPTADQIYLALQPQIPRLSRMTIYNTLRVFVDHGLCRDVRIEENQVRYDGIVRNHGHFKCTDCGGLMDFDMPEAAFEAETLHGYHIEQRDIFYRGRCPLCEGKRQSSEPPATNNWPIDN